MTHIITAKGKTDVNAGNGSWDAGTPIAQTECATELIINRLAAIDLLNTGRINKSATVVTLLERKFLYENLFDNVEVFNPKRRYEKVIDLVTHDMLMKLCRSLPYKPFYRNYERDRDQIHNINYNQDIINKDMDDFLVCIPRLKNSDTRRNLDQQYWSDFLQVAKKEFSKIIVFGKGNDNLSDGDSVIYVDTLQDYCSYIHHKNCTNIVSTISGPCHYAQSFSNTSGKTKLTMIDNLGLIAEYGNDPSYFHPCINFTNIDICFINELPDPKELHKML